jgi:hypothetical protein
MGPCQKAWPGNVSRGRSEFFRLACLYAWVSLGVQCTIGFGRKAFNLDTFSK